MERIQNKESGIVNAVEAPWCFYSQIQGVAKKFRTEFDIRRSFRVKVGVRQS